MLCNDRMNIDLARIVIAVKAQLVLVLALLAMVWKACH